MASQPPIFCTWKWQLVRRQKITKRRNMFSEWGWRMVLSIYFRLIVRLVIYINPKWYAHRCFSLKYLAIHWVWYNSGTRYYIYLNALWMHLNCLLIASIMCCSHIWKYSLADFAWLLIKFSMQLGIVLILDVCWLYSQCALSYVTRWAKTHRFSNILICHNM